MSEQSWDAFISYRRKDGLALAKWIRGCLLNFKLPKEVLGVLDAQSAELHKRRPRVWLDTVYERPSDDFLTKKVFPALDRSRRLLVVSTPSALEPIPGPTGPEPNWLVREVDRFILQGGADRNERPIDLVLGPGAADDKFPGPLAARTRFDWIDLRAFSWWRRWNPLDESLDAAAAKLIAGLYSVPETSLPALQRVARRQRLFWLSFGFVIATLVALAMAVLAAYAVREQSKAETSARFAQSRQLSALVSESLSKDIPLALLLGAAANHAAPTLEARASLLNVFRHAPQLHRVLAHEAPLHSIAFSPDGETLAAGSVDHSLLLWNVASGKHIAHVKDQRGSINSVAFSPSGQILATGGDGSVILWALANVGQLREIKTLESINALNVAFSPKGDSLASASSDGSIVLWEVPSGKQVKRLKGHHNAVHSLAFSPDGRTLASASYGHEVILWQVADDSPVPLRIGKVRGARGISFSPDGNTLALASEDGTVVLWDVRSGAQAAQLKGDQRFVRSVTFSHDGKTLASGGDDIILWDLESRKRISKLKGLERAEVLDVAFSPDDSKLASASVVGSILFGSKDFSVLLWALDNGVKPIVYLKGHQSPVHSVAFSLDSKMLASGSIARNDAAPGEDRNVILWEVATGKQIAKLEGHAGGVFCVAFAPDGKALASASGHNVILWDTLNGRRLGDLTGLDNTPIRSIDFSPDGKFIAATSGGSILIWEAESGDRVAELSHHAGEGMSVAFSPDGKRIASGHSNGSVIQWEMSSRKKIAERSAQSGVVNSVAFSRDGKRLASGHANGTLILWEIASHRIITVLSGHEREILSVSFSPDGKVIASAGFDRSLIFWDTSSRKKTAHFKGLDLVNSVSFAGNGKFLASGGADGNVIIWDTLFQQWQNYACEKANRNLTCSEWMTYVGEEAPYQRVCKMFPVPSDFNFSKQDCSK
jgi:WD40 repeat protein